VGWVQVERGWERAAGKWGRVNREVDRDGELR